MDDDDEYDESAEIETKHIWLKEQMRAKIGEFSNELPLTIFCGSWNVNTRTLSTDNDPMSSRLHDWIIPEGSTPCDIYAIGFQEIVDLNAVNVVISDQKTNEKVMYWRSKIEETLASLPGTGYGHGYSVLMEKSLVGLALLVYVKNELLVNIRDARAAAVPTGVLGIMGNKGGVCIRFDYHLTSYCFICAHFQADRDAVLLRNSNFQTIMERTQLVRDSNSAFVKADTSFRAKWWYDEGSTVLSIASHDAIFWLGDLNYRIDTAIPTEIVFAKVLVGDWQSLRKNDQLNIERSKSNVFNGFQEGEISFPPTYKFQQGSDSYEQRNEKKLRAPAWCDRILWKAANESSVKLLQYRRSGLLPSDHKPVSATFACMARESIVDKEKTMYQDLLSIIDRWENANTPRVEVPVRNLDFGEVKFMAGSSATIQVRNIGGVIARWKFIPKTDDEHFCHQCIHLSPVSGVLSPGETATITATITVDEPTWRGMQDQKTTRLDDIIIIRCVGGSDFFCLVSAEVNAASVAEYEAAVAAAAREREADIDMDQIYNVKDEIPEKE